MTVRLVLASASPARLSVLRGAGVSPQVVVSQVDEDAVQAALPAGTSHGETVAELARAKALDVAARLDPSPGRTVVIGCDSMLSIDGALVGKPHTPEVATERWRAMRGRTGDLLTGHCAILLDDGAVAGPASIVGGTRSTTLRFGAPSDAEIEAYVATGEPLEVAGGFTLDGLGGWFVESVDGDPSSVIGISLPLTRELLGGLGVSPVELWSDRA